MEKFKLVLCIANGLVSAAKYTLYKNLLLADTPDQRECLEQFLGKLCSADKEQKGLVKEVTVKASNESTPANTKKVIIPDASMVGMEVDRYRNKFNKGCKAIRYPSMVLLATNSGRNVVTKHKLKVDAFGNPIAARASACCPISSCKEKYEVEVTEIAPMYIGPQTHRRLGNTVWPCVSHWRESIENSSDDEFIVSTGIKYEASQFEKSFPES